MSTTHYQDMDAKVSLGEETSPSKSDAMKDESLNTHGTTPLDASWTHRSEDPVIITPRETKTTFVFGVKPTPNLDAMEEEFYDDDSDEDSIDSFIGDIDTTLLLDMDAVVPPVVTPEASDLKLGFGLVLKLRI